MKKIFVLKRAVILLSGLLFAVYSAYNVFIIIRDGSAISTKGIIISALVALAFALIAGFAFTSGFNTKNIRFMMFRSTVFNIALAVVFVLKLRMAGEVVSYVKISKLYTIFYGGAYVMTLAAMLALFVYYFFILRRLPLYPKAGVILPLAALILFFFSFVFEIILFFVYNIGLEPSVLRTLVIRPVFYLAYIGLCAYFLFPAPDAKQPVKKK